MSAVPKPPLLTAQRYLEIEREAKEKSQFFRGEMFAMAGASAQHNLIVANVIGELRAAIAAECLAFASDLRVAIDLGEHYVYPDAVVVCGEPRYLDDASDTLLNPTVVVEVLSESTERYDRGLKFTGYRNLDSVSAVVFISQDRPMVEVYIRQDDNRWLLHDYRLPADASASIPPLGIAVPLEGLYRGVRWTDETPTPPDDRADSDDPSAATG